MPRYFTLDEARETLATIRPLMEEVRRRKLMFDTVQAEVEALQGRVTGDGDGQEAERLTQHRMALQELGRAMAVDVGRVLELGVQVKDLARGMVDFRTERAGKDVYLCWQVGEDDIGWWHELEAGFAGRRPL